MNAKIRRFVTWLDFSHAENHANGTRLQLVRVQFLEPPRPPAIYQTLPNASRARV
jgi:hypothetical protein